MASEFSETDQKLAMVLRQSVFRIEAALRLSALQTYGVSMLRRTMLQAHAHTIMQGSANSNHLYSKYDMLAQPQDLRSLDEFLQAPRDDEEDQFTVSVNWATDGARPIPFKVSSFMYGRFKQPAVHFMLLPENGGHEAFLAQHPGLDSFKILGTDQEQVLSVSQNYGTTFMLYRQIPKGIVEIDNSAYTVWGSDLGEQAIIARAVL